MVITWVLKKKKKKVLHLKTVLDENENANEVQMRRISL